jgi:glycosyltransferase involved in cell wall biosynthesis
MKKVAILCNTFCGNSGVDRVVFQQAERYAREGKCVTIFSFECDMSPPNGVNLRVISRPHNYILERIWRLLVPTNIIKMATMYLNLKDFSEIYSHHYPWNWWAFIAKTLNGSKYIYYYHHLNPPESYDKAFQRLYVHILNFLTKWTARGADTAISISRFSQESLLREFGMKSKIIENEIDESHFKAKIDDRYVRLKYGLNDDPLILFVGGIRPPKCVHLLIDAFYILKQTVPNAKLIIVGSGQSSDYYNKIREMSDASIIFAGYVEDNELPYYYAACNVYATASLWEGFNLPLEEAKMSGKRVVAFDIGAHRERIKDLSDGILVPAGDITLMAKAIENVIVKLE